MAEEQTGEMQLLRSLKVELIEILSADADFVLQHADARSLLSPAEYEQVKACRVSGEKVRDLLDHVIHRGPEAAQGLLELLKDHALQEAFPMLNFMKHLEACTLASDCRRETGTKRKSATDLQESVASKQICNNGSHLVKEKQLMLVARAVGRSWREIGRLALELSSVKLEQIEEDHATHVERVFAMLRYWQSCQREKATASRLHSLLSQDSWALPPESIDFLLETD